MSLHDALNFISSVDRLRAALDEWAERCAQISGIAELSSLERKAMVQIGLSNTYTRFSRLCFDLAAKEQHLVTYALRKLEKNGIVVRKREGKEVEFALTEVGRERFAAYCKVLGESFSPTRLSYPGTRRQGRNPIREWAHGLDDAARHLIVRDLEVTLDHDES